MGPLMPSSTRNAATSEKLDHRCGAAPPEFQTPFAAKELTGWRVLEVGAFKQDGAIEQPRVIVKRSVIIRAQEQMHVDIEEPIARYQPPPK
jgi:hypothetical protein